MRAGVACHLMRVYLLLGRMLHPLLFVLGRQRQTPKLIRRACAIMCSLCLAVSTLALSRYLFFSLHALLCTSKVKEEAMRVRRGCFHIAYVLHGLAAQSAFYPPSHSTCNVVSSVFWPGGSDIGDSGLCVGLNGSALVWLTPSESNGTDC